MNSTILQITKNFSDQLDKTVSGFQVQLQQNEARADARGHDLSEVIQKVADKVDKIADRIKETSNQIR